MTIAQKVLFIDRDGVLNEDPKETYYVHNISEFKLIDKALAAIQKLKATGFLAMVISNQAGIGKGEVMQSDLDQITQVMHNAFKVLGVQLDGVYYCPHKSDAGCDCRKPLPGLLKQATMGIAVDKEGSYMIGDSQKDVLAGHAFGIKAILVLTGKTQLIEVQNWSDQPDFIANDFEEAATWILAN
ncbi:MAG: D-glycero-D-manno-heptose 1,7-bisphosphate phosphatase [Candidatus Omnitrophota bacterium]|jgi:D-glycero-D-manno-heptose 1,7-bisphosphate phosphatase